MTTKAAANKTTSTDLDHPQRAYTATDCDDHDGSDDRFAQVPSPHAKAMRYMTALQRTQYLSEQALLDRVAVARGPVWMSPAERIALARAEREGASREGYES